MSNTTLYLIVGALIAGHAGYWFLSGEQASHSTARNILVILQAVAGLGLMYWAVRNKPRRRTR